MEHLLQPTPEFFLDDILSEGLSAENTFFLGCLSYEERSLTTKRRIVENMPFDAIHTTFFTIQDDECSHQPWKDECEKKTNEYFNALNRVMAGRSCFYCDYKMSNRSEDFLRMREQVLRIVNVDFEKQDNVRCILDVTCFPSYFALQLLKVLIEIDKIKDLILLYTKPFKYSEGTLKYSPRDSSRANYLPFYGNQGINNVNWVVGVGFDYNSVSNAALIKETLTVESTKVVVPFPGFKHEFFLRTILENSPILDDHKKYSYVKADSPFLTFSLVDNLISGMDNCILSTFGPKPMSLGFGLAAIKNNTPILHIQATNYNPNFSIGEKETHSYLFKSKGKSFLGV